MAGIECFRSVLGLSVDVGAERSNPRACLASTAKNCDSLLTSACVHRLTRPPSARLPRAEWVTDYSSFLSAQCRLFLRHCRAISLEDLIARRRSCARERSTRCAGAARHSRKEEIADSAHCRSHSFGSLELRRINGPKHREPRLLMLSSPGARGPNILRSIENDRPKNCEHAE